MSDFSAPTFAKDGALHFQTTLVPSLGQLKDALAGLPSDEAGIRIRDHPALAPFLAIDACMGAMAAEALGKEARPVRAILFDKSPANNWSLGWHQDRTICVRERREVAGFGPWTIKGGMQHVAPLVGILSRMVTLRAHLDDVSSDNAPLLIAPGSHAFGRVAEGDIDAVVERCGTTVCLAHAGDVWLYSTLILHASEAAAVPSRRRVLQVDYAAEALPGGLEWLGV